MNVESDCVTGIFFFLGHCCVGHCLWMWGDVLVSL